MQHSFSFRALNLAAGLILTASALASCGEESSGPATPDLPEATLHASILDSGDIDVRIAVPDRHHAYLDAGREGVLIPVSFDWDLPGQAAAPKTTVAPIGDMYEDAGARVLRGMGRWVFQPAQGVDTGEVKIRTQICDEVKGVCYPPQKNTLTLKKAGASS